MSSNRRSLLLFQDGTFFVSLSATLELFGQSPVCDTCLHLLFCFTFFNKLEFSLAFFFWTKLRASLQQWQSLNCAIIVIVRQPVSKRSGTENKNQNQNKNPPTHNQTPQPVPDQLGWEGETSSGSHGNLQSPALTTSSSGNSQGPMQCRQLCYSSSIIDLLPLLSPAIWYVLLTTNKLQRYDLLFLSNLSIHASKHSLLTRKLNGRSWLTKLP